MKKLNLIIMFLVVLFAVLPLSANTCLDFDGLNDHVLVPSNSELRPTNNFTIEVWIKPTDIITQQVIIMHDENGGGNDGYSLTIINSVINFGAHNGSPQYITSDEMLVVNSWNYIAAVYDNSTLKLYVNGVSKTLVGSGSVVYSLTSSVNIGRRGGTNLPNTLFYDGEMDELRFWNVARTETEINDNMFHSLTGSESGLVSYWQFDEGTGTNLGDSAGSNDGTLTNMEEADWVESPFFIPIVQSFSPTDNSTGILLDSDLEIIFDRNITAGSGNIIIHKTSDDSIVETISASSCEIVDSSVTIDPSDFKFNTDYYILIEGNAFHDGYGDYYYGISDKTVWNFESQNLFLDINAGLQGVDNSSVAWGDYDNDGDLDILLTGHTAESTEISKIYCNDSGVFTDINAGLTGVAAGSVAWGDYDNDGDLDILLTGWSDTDDISKIYRNDSLVFTDINTGLSEVYFSSVACGDYDNDGGLDILLTGYTGANIISNIYRNENGYFTSIPAGLSGIATGSVAWGDYDNDGDLDILLTGRNESSINISKIYRNENGLFTDIGAGLTGIYFSSVAWGDYDNDGDLDVLLSGDTETEIISKIYRNDSGVFTDIEAGLTGVSGGGVAWGDYDNDGDLDILLTGRNESSINISKIYRNDSLVFTDINAGLTGVGSGSVAWGDYDNDGDLDILLIGRDSDDHKISRIYNNGGSVFNTVPEPPLNLTTEVNGSEITFSWDKATDIETPQDGLSYNLYVGTTVDNKDRIKSSMSDISTGYRKIVSLGNLNNNTSWTIKDIDASSYYCWSVQAVDHAFAGSVFATEQVHLPIGNPVNLVTTVNGTNIELTWDAVQDVSFYKVFASDDPYGIFVLIGVEMEEIWITPYTESKKFYYVIAVSGKEEVENADLRSVQTKR